MKNFIKKIYTNKIVDKRTQVYYLIFIFCLSFIVRLLAFTDITLFSFSDFKIYYEIAFKLAEGGSLPIFHDNIMPSTLMHTGAFFITYLGSIDYWFFMNFIIAGFTIIILWFIVFNITRNCAVANITVLIVSVYPPYVFLSNIFYTQIILLFFSSVIIFSLIKALTVRKFAMTVLYLAISLLTLILSFFFKWELLYFYYFVGLFAIIIFIKGYRRDAYVAFLFAISAFIIIQLISILHPPINNYIKNGDNSLFFFGQTPYAGGEGMILKEYEEVYKKGLANFMRDHKDEYETYIDFKNAYQSKLIKEFMTQHPDQWIILQITKFFRTLGIKPEGLSYKLISTGKIKIPVVITSAILTLPFVLLFLASIIFFDASLIKKLSQSSIGLFMIMALCYYVIATIFYPHYQIRYRLPLEILFLCPVASAFIYNAFKKNVSYVSIIKKNLIIKLIVVFIFVSSWIYESYYMLVLNKERYFKNIETLDERKNQ